MKKNIHIYHDYPLKAVEYIKNEIGNDKRIYNDYGWGSLLMYNNIKVFIDSRCDLYTQEYNSGCTVAKDYADAENCYKDFNEIFEKYNIEYLFIDKERPLYYNVVNNEKYEEIYTDDIASIFIVKK